MALMTITSSEYEGIPPGAYKATFGGLEEIETSNGKAWRWRFSVSETVSGDKTHADKSVSELSDREKPPSTRNKTGRFLAGLAAKPLEAGVQVNPDEYVGRTYLLAVEPKEGGSKIASFTLLG
jgi:hypothetical protein